MNASWHDLLANLGVLAVFLSVWTHLRDRLNDLSPRLRVGALALLTSCGVLALMLLPFEIQDGIFADLRSTLIALSGFFGGPIVGVITGLVAGAYRMWLGGAGWWAGIIGIGTATLIGTIGHFVVRTRGPRRADVVILAAAVAAAGVLGFFLLPQAMWATIIPEVGLPIATLVFVSTVLAGFAMIQEMRRAEAAEANLMYRAVFDALPDPLNAKDASGKFLAANPATAALMLAGTADALIGRTDFDFYPVETARHFRDDEIRIMAAGVATAIEQRLVHRDGTNGWLSTLKAPLRNHRGEIVGLLTLNRDITDRKRLEDEIAESRNRLSDALANMADGLVLFDRDRRLVFCNEQYLALFPKTADVRVPGARLRDILLLSLARGEQAGVENGEAEQWIQAVYAAMDALGDREIQTQDGRWLHARIRPTADGGALSLMSDITAAKSAARALAQMNERLETLARTDGLTGLVNRRSFDETLVREVGRAARHGTSVGLILVDIDKFKPFNDTYGHPAGDECLRAVSKCFRETLKRPGDLVARYGGEELAALLPDTTCDGAIQVGEAVRAAVRDLNIVHAGSEKGAVTVSIGVSAFEQPDIGGHDLLLKRADEALYAAKAAGRDCVRSWRPPVRIAPLRKVVGSR
ncbi:MAG: diguanylate cyclase [Bauldia sp.]